MESVIEQYVKENSICYVVRQSSCEKKTIYEFCKRVFDVAAAFFMGIILVIPMLLIAGYVRLDSRGPAIFKQERLGLNGKPFTIYKFRTMYTNAEENGPQWAERIDYRCTRAGHILRKTRMDELPQLWNIFIGDMSFVGPRPEMLENVYSYTEDLPEFKYRLRVKAGLTGYAQIAGKYNTSPKDKLVLDLMYIEKYSLWLDFKLILQTVTVLLKASDSTEAFGQGEFKYRFTRED